MKYEISQDRKQLKIVVSSEEQAELRELENIHSIAALCDFLQPISCNSELEWIPEGATGDPTSAPMLGILGDESTIDEIEHLAKSEPGIFGSLLCGHCNGKDRHQPILERWVFMDYRVRSVLEDLRDKGECVFVS